MGKTVSRVSLRRIDLESSFKQPEIKLRGRALA
jgi:hypothetical protein